MPADLRLIKTNELSIDESILTGESMPKSKDDEVESRETGFADRANIAYAGSIVTKGRGEGVVIAVGKNTEFGKVADKVIASDETKSPLIIRMDKFTKQISLGFVIFAITMVVVLYLKNYTIEEIFSTVVALTVSAIPEGLTIAMTIILSISASKMVKKNVIVKKINAVESLGSCTRIVTDKTGTLTANEQTAKKVVLPNGEMAYIKGVGYNDEGEVKFDSNVSIETKNQVKEIARLGMLNNEADLKVKDNKWVKYGDAIDIAFLAFAYKMNLKKSNKIIDRIPYESKLKYSSVVYEEEIDGEVKIFITVKGGIEKVLQLCDGMYVNGEKIPINYNEIINQADDLSSQGFRVIAIAKGEKVDFRNNGKYIEADIPKLTYMGMVAFVDPIREDVIEAIQKCKKAGIGVSMVTGDYSVTANAIANRLGINDVHSRVSPMDKLKIVEDFKNNGEFIAVTGDGVNDTPALKAANIGIAMGSGTDIAKETGNMIIIDDNFSSIVRGIEEGRKAYNNIRKIIYFLLSVGFSEIILFVLAIIFNFPIPLAAIQLLWLNLISNTQGNALAFEKDIDDVMNKKVKSTKERIVNKLLVSEIFISSFVMAITEFLVYAYCIKVKNYNIEFTRTILLTLMVFMENVHMFNCRSETLSAFKISSSNNKLLIASLLISSLIQVLIVTSEVFSKFFKLTVIGISDVLILLILTIFVIIVMEIFKKLEKKCIKC